MTTEQIVAIIVTIFASTGFWSFLQSRFQRRDEKEREKNKAESAETQMIKGLGHDRICYLGECYLEKGYITKDDYENLHDYLYVPYKKLGGNGTAERIMKEVEQLPLKEKEEKNHG